MAHPNEEALRRFADAQDRGDIPAMLELFSDDVVAHIGGRSFFAGDYKGKDALLDAYGKFMGSLGEITKNETHDILANDRHGTMLQTTVAERGGDSITINGAAILHFTDGKVSEAWFLDEDPYTADAWYDAGQ